MVRYKLRAEVQSFDRILGIAKKPKSTEERHALRRQISTLCPTS